MFAVSQTESLSLHVLETYHPHICPLLVYFEQNIDSGSLSNVDLSPHDSLAGKNASVVRDYLLKDDDETAYRKLIMKAFVAETIDSHAKQGALKPKMKISTPSMSMTELIDRAQARLFAKRGRPSNMITAGYRSAEFRSQAGIGGARQGITNFFVNTIVDTIQEPEWDKLLSRFHDNSQSTPVVYAPPPNGRSLVGYIVSDQHIEEASRKRKAEEAPSKKSRKRRRSKQVVDINHEDPLLQANEEGILPLSANKKTAADTPISRIELFYARPCRQAKSSRVLIGLPLNHILNRMKSNVWRKSKGLDMDEIKDSKNDLRPSDLNGALEARHLSKYIFSQQYKLSNVHVISMERTGEGSFQRKQFADREDEIKRKGACKTPARLRSTLPLLAQLYHRHKKCGYKALLDKVCPSKLKPDHRDSTVDSSVILELISEELSEVQLHNQIDVDTTDDFASVSMRGGSYKSRLSKGSQIKYKPKFSEYTCSYAEVFLYVRAVSKVVVPHAFWGCIRNRKAVMLHVKQLISSRRYESITLHNIIQGVSTSECDWLLPPEKSKPVRHLNQSMAEMLKRRELLEEFLYWYFDQFLVPLLRTTFYITDSSAFRNRVLYFRQDDWEVLCHPLLDRLAATTFQRIRQHEAEDLLRQRKLGYSFVRLLPKDSGVRPIVNLRRKRMTMQAEQLGASVFGPNEIYLRLKDYKKRLGIVPGKKQKLYFVKVDVQACFDTIEQDKLLGILKSLVSEDVYMIQKYGQILPTAGKIKRTYMREAMPERALFYTSYIIMKFKADIMSKCTDEHPHFLTHAAQLAALLRHAIFVDQVVYPFAFRDDIIQLLEDHITSNIVKIGQDYYRQRVGIPQGSVLSTLLCSFFYGDLERNALRFVLEAQNNVLLRLIDDYLFITTDEEDASHFLEVMNRGHPEYGCFISRDKTLTNFYHGTGNLSQLNLSPVLYPGQKLFPWCGYLIDTEDLSIMNDYSRFHNTYLTDSLTIERGRRPNSAFVQKMLQIAKAKTHAIFTDTAHNSAYAVRTNVHQAFVLAAMKMHAYIRASGRSQATGGLAFVLNPGLEDKVKAKPYLDSRKKTRSDGAFVLNAIRQSIRYTYSSIRNKVSGKIVQQAGGHCSLSKAEVLWLGAHAFHSVLSIKRTAYAQAGVLDALASDLGHARNNHIRRRLLRLARESLAAMLRDIPF
ncbi:hypothetical protein EW145_g4492 [Phellinidium pouzarii]|uniref:Telomerase reverse transcriptase n=1 Tax=Phellinidium pouzarii TaxID=167371 RepID=A0A4S4L3I3_9AGAM|nr:hypothetical protein EW145_g4492 [Phellinidium pouzarii]